MYSGNHSTPNYTQSQGYYEGGAESDDIASSIEKNIVDSLDLDDENEKYSIGEIFTYSSIFSSNIYWYWWSLLLNRAEAIIKSLRIKYKINRENQ